MIAFVLLLIVLAGVGAVGYRLVSQGSSPRAARGVLLLIGLALLVVWLGEHWSNDAG